MGRSAPHEGAVVVQALLALLAQSKVPEEYIEQKQKEQEASDDDADDDAAVAAAAKDKKSNFCLKMLSGIVDPMRQVLSAAKTLYPRKQADGQVDLVRRRLSLTHIKEPTRVADCDDPSAHPAPTRNAMYNGTIFTPRPQLSRHAPARPDTIFTGDKQKSPHRCRTRR